MVKSAPIAAAAAALLALPVALGDGLYAKNSPVLQVDGSSYNRLITKSNHTSIVEFYAPWCGHCQNLKPAFEKAAKSLTGLAKVAAVNCDEESNKQFCGSMGVQGFPTLKIVKPGKKPGKPYVEDYRGERTAKAIVDAVVDKIPNYVKKLKADALTKWIAESDEPKAILFSDKASVSALLKSVAIDFLGGVEVAQVPSSEAEAAKSFGVTSFPTLVLLPGGGQDPLVHTGEMKKDAIVQFLSRAATPNPDPAPKAGKSSGVKEDKAAKSKFSKSSASQASKQAQTDAASQTLESLEDDATPSPDPQIKSNKPVKLSEPAPPLPSLPDGLSLQQECLNNKAGWCILALLHTSAEPSLELVKVISGLSKIHHKHTTAGRSIFPFFQSPMSNSQAALLRTKLELSDGVEVIAVNGKRGTWLHYTSRTFSERELEDWVDSILLGDAPKQKLPEGLIIDRDLLPKEKVVPLVPNQGNPKIVNPEDDSPELAAMRESFRSQLPDGVDFEIEEVSDEEVERLSQAQAGAKVDDHDEL